MEDMTFDLRIAAIRSNIDYYIQSYQYCVCFGYYSQLAFDAYVDDMFKL